MDVKRQHFIENKERATFKLFVYLNVFNLLFHIVKITLCVLWMAGAWQSQESQFDIVSISDDVWVVSLSFMILVTGTRLLLTANKNHLEGYNNHKTQTLIMMIVLICCEMSSVYFAFLSKTLVASNNDVKFATGLVVTFLPAVCFLFTKRTEDCIGCFNKFTSRYSSF